MKININGRQATVEMSVEHLMGILELVAQRSCGYGQVAIEHATRFWGCCEGNELVEMIVNTLDTTKLDEINKSYVDEIKKEMKRNGRY